MFDFSVEFRAIDNVTAKVNSINSKMATMGGKAKEASNKIEAQLGNMDLKARLQISTEKAMQKLRNVQQEMNSIGEAGRDLAGKGIQSLVAGAAAAATMLQPLNVARKYELAFRDVLKAVDGTPEQLTQLRKEMKLFQGASFEELAVITAEAGKMGFNAENVLAFSESVMKGAKALDFNAELAVGQVGKILTMTSQMNTAVESGKDIMNKVVNLENNLAGVKGAGVIDIWKRSADTFAQLNFDNKTMGAVSAFLEQTSVSSELGASGFNIMMNRFKSLEGELGFFEHIKLNGIEGIKDVMDEIAKLTPEEQIKKFGSQAMTLIAKLQNHENIAKLDIALQVSESSAGAVISEWERFRATFDERLNDSKKKFFNMMDALGKPMLKISSDFLERVNPIVDKIGKWVSENEQLVASIMKWGVVLGIVLAVFGVLAVVVGVFGMAIGALSTVMLVITGRFGLLAIASWALNTALWANPITWVVVGVVALIASVVALIYYWKDITAWVSKLWDKFTGFVSGLSLVEGAVALLAGAFSVLTAPVRFVVGLINELWGKFTGFVGDLSLVEGGIRLIAGAFGVLTAPISFAIDLIDKFLSKFDIYNNAKAKITEIGGRVDEGVSSAWDSAKSWIGFGDKDEGENKVQGSSVDNTIKNHTVVDVNVTAVGGAKTEASVKGTGGVKLRNIENGIGGL